MTRDYIGISRVRFSLRVTKRKCKHMLDLLDVVSWAAPLLFYWWRFWLYVYYLEEGE